MTDLDGFALVTWDVDPAALAHHLPPRFRPDTRPVDGRERGFVSAVPFVDRGFHFRFAPYPRLSCGQVNHRTYVVDRDGRRGVWFFGTSLGSRLVQVPRALWRMPWHRERVEVSLDGERYRAEVTGAFGALDLRLRRTGAPLVMPPELVDPFVGWYPRTGGTPVGRYSVWHEPLALERCEVEAASVELHHRLGLVEPGTPPLWAGVQPTTRFDVHTPPHRER